ncbi:hypothetical protein C1646_763336 [Rhizophagus diaphanus]|nr:hypothetical protein C1646_763336 [Rhizophagus diaphanus] [Rhizophagus sp. MUCL 43196]
MSEEESFDEISESERVSLKFNEIINYINDNTDNTSAFSDLDFEELKDIDEEIKEHEICDEMDKVIDDLKQQKFTSCVIIDYMEGNFWRCEGTGVCDSHFQFDNKYLYQSSSKKIKDFNKGIIQWRRCISCNKYVTFFSRDAGCAIHSWYLNKKNIQVSCIGQYKYKALQSYPNLFRGKSTTTCITKKLHEGDITKGLEFIGNLLIKIAQMGYFRQLLKVCHVISHTDRCERQLAKIRMDTTDPSKCLIKGNNIWNLAIIDNIDFKEKTFKFVKTGPEQVIELTAETLLFRMNQEFTYNTNFNAETIKYEILNKLDYGSCGKSPNIVILKPGSNSNSDEEIFHVAEMYKKDFAMESNSFLDIVADEAIFHQLIKCQEKWPYIRPLLDKFESAIDYRSTAQALETFGVRFIKGNISGNVIDEKNLKNQIKASQSERERIDLLMSEYLNDNSISHSERAIKSRQESLWLVNDQVEIFEIDNSLSYQLFQKYKPTEIHQEELDCLIAYYPNGLERIKEIYRQEVLKIENRNTKDTDEILNEDHLPDTTNLQLKQKKHRTTKEEMEILSALKVYKDKLPDDAISSVCEYLSEI